MRILHVVHGVRPMTAELALLLGRAFGQSPHYWLNLQATSELKAAREALGTRLEQVEALLDRRGK